MSANEKPTGKVENIVFEREPKHPDLVESQTVGRLEKILLSLGTGNKRKSFTRKILEHTNCSNFTISFLNEWYNVNSSRPDDYKEFSYYTFGNHYNCWDIKPKYLAGRFRIVNKTGTIYFADDITYVTPCVFVNNKEEISDFWNYEVVIKKFIWITELYNCTTPNTTPKSIAVEYLLIDLEDVEKLDKFTDDCVVFSDESDEELENRQKLSFKVVSKSQPTVISRSEVISWIEVLVAGQTVFLRLNRDSHNIYPFLNVGGEYTLFHHDNLIRHSNFEISKLFKRGNPLKSVNFCDVPPESRFVCVTRTSPRCIIDQEQAAVMLRRHQGLISFEGVIALKLFNQPVQSRTSKILDDPNYNTPGYKTPKLRFQHSRGYFEVYLNNWENFANVYGLVPNMRVIVYNVISQKGNYYKATALTSFEIIRYEVGAKVETASLYSMCQWGVPTILGLGSHLPVGSIVWGKPPSYFILGAKFSVQQENKINGNITLIVSDEVSESKIIAKDKCAIELLRLLLRMTQHYFEKFRKCLPDLGEFNYSKNQITFADDGTPTLKRALYRYFSNLEHKNVSLNFKVRKMDQPTGKGPVYFLLAVRP